MKLIFGEKRAKAGTVKDKVAALKIGDTLTTTDRCERHTLYIAAKRLGMRLSADGNTMKRIS